jgi:4-amino-4-deoxy-L-arabinose transferase-like glycosyltransferase
MALAPGTATPVAATGLARVPPGWRPRAASARQLLYWMTLPLVTAWAVVDSYLRLGVPPATQDETVYTLASWRYVHWNSSYPVDHRSNFEHPPLAKFLFGEAELVAGHPSLVAARVIGATCTLLAGVVLGLWLWRAAGRWAALLAGAAVVLVPVVVVPQVTNFGRDAMLDPVAELFMVAGVALSWFWFRCRGYRAWLLALLAGMATGLAAASKENGFLGVAGAVLLGLALSARTPRLLGVRLAQTAAAIVVAAGAFLATYVPVGHPLEHIRYLVDFQWGSHRQGHLVGFAGEVSARPPWWANLWFAGHGLGPVVTVTVCASALAAVALRRDRVVWWCLAALAGPFVFHCLVAGNALPFYWVMWMPALFALSALGICAVAARVRDQRRVTARLGRAALAVAAVAALAVAAVGETTRVVTQPREGAVALPALRAAYGLDGAVLATRTYVNELRPYLGRTQLYTAVPRNLHGIDTVLIGQPRCRTRAAPEIVALVRANLARGALREVHADRLLRVYVVTGPLRPPTAGQIAAQPVGSLTTGC